MRENVPTETETISQDLLVRLKGSYLSASLAILSIVQGVALAALSASLVANYAHFSLAQFILAADTFGVIITVYTQIVIEMV